MYTIYIKSGIVVRDADGMQILPTINPNNPNPPELAEYYSWVGKGNAPTPDFRDPEEVLRSRAKGSRREAIDCLQVTVGSLIFDADEESQARMNLALQVMEDGESCQWIMADNTIRQISKDTLRKAQRLAWEKTSNLWLAPKMLSTLNLGPTPLGPNIPGQYIPGPTLPSQHIPSQPVLGQAPLGGV
jgi:hypothetical protein